MKTIFRVDEQSFEIKSVEVEDDYIPTPIESYSVHNTAYLYMNDLSDRIYKKEKELKRLHNQLQFLKDRYYVGYYRKMNKGE